MNKIRKRLNEDASARVEREKRRRKVLVEQLTAHQALEVRCLVCIWTLPWTFLLGKDYLSIKQLTNDISLGLMLGIFLSVDIDGIIPEFWCFMF